MRNQVTLASDNLEAVLSAADMGLADIPRLTIYTTDVDEAMQHFDVFGARFLLPTGRATSGDRSARNCSRAQLR